MRVYATTADYAQFTGDQTTDALLRRASLQIDGITSLSVFEVDGDGNPTDPDVTQAFTDATCAQVAWWAETGDVTGAESQSGPTKIGSVAFGGSGASGGAANTKSASIARVAPEAISILRAAGVLNALVSHT